MLSAIRRDVEALPRQRERVALFFDYWVMGTRHPGVQRAINLMHAEIDRDLALLGIRSLSEITPDLVRKF